VVWSDTSALCCPYKVLFQPSELFSVIPKSRRIRWLRPSSQPAIQKRLLAFLRNKILGIDHFFNENDILSHIITNEFYFDDFLKDYKSIYIQTCQQFQPIDKALQEFRPVEAVQLLIDKMSAAFDDHTIGVHIRRTDNEESIIHSPLNNFIELMENEIIADKKATFFLATDDSAVEKKLIDRFGTRIIVYEKDRSRETVKGVQDALVDLLCLASTKRIIGSYWSSFSEVAACFNQIPLQIATDISK
jgi:hypothetical protein